jgi:putative transposase
MRSVFSALMAYVVSRCRTHASLRLETMALRHQLAVYQQSVKRPKRRPSARLFWSWLSHLWPDGQRALEFVHPRTVIAWQKKRFRNAWRHLSHSGKMGRQAMSKAARDRIRDMWRSTPTWGSPRIVGALRTLGIPVAKSTVEKYRPRACKPSAPTWQALLNTHLKDIGACDCFIVPTASFKVLLVFIILAHERRRIVHVNMTAHPPAIWTAQQIVAAFPWDPAPRYLLRAHDSVYRVTCQHRIKNIGLEAVQIAPRSPWQNPDCERRLGSLRRAVLAPVIVLHDQHLGRGLTAYIAYYHR